MDYNNLKMFIYIDKSLRWNENKYKMIINKNIPEISKYYYEKGYYYILYFHIEKCMTIFILIYIFILLPIGVYMKI